MVALAGCSSAPPDPTPEEKAATSAAMVERIFDQAADNAIVAEGAVYPYHFVTHAAALNELGERHVATLAAAYARNPGRLMVAQGDAPTALHTARVKVVLDALAAAGVDTARVATDSNLPGGPGINSPDAVRAINGRDTSRQSEGGSGRTQTQTEGR